ncbi:MAG: hypothetical protein ABIR92_00805 [Gemmatimonadaceae bacterium]
MMLQPRRGTLATIALCAALAACDRESTPASQGAARLDSASGEAAQYALMKNNIGWLTDSNIVALAGQLNRDAQKIAQLEADVWASVPLHALALDLIRDHSRLQVSIDSVASLRRLPSQAPAVAPMMQAPYDSLLATQVGLPMTERESKLIEMLSAVHDRTITDFGALAGNATDPDLRAVLATRGVLMEQAHLARIKLLDAAMVKSDSAKRDSASTPRRGRAR